MGVRFPSVQSNVFIGPLPANANETIIIQTPPFNLSIDNAVVYLGWQCQITAGTSTTSLVFRIRRGALLTSTQISPQFWAFTTVAGNVVSVGGMYFDSPGVVAGQQYTLTVSQTAATVAGNFQDGALLAMVL